MKTLEEKIEHLGDAGLRTTMDFVDGLIPIKDCNKSANWFIVAADNGYDFAKDARIIDQISYSLHKNKNSSLWKYIRGLRAKSFISGCAVTIGLGYLILYLYRKEKHNEE